MMKHIGLFLFACFSAVLSANERCPSVNVFGKALFQDVCWSCMLPIQWGDLSLGGGYATPRPADANTDYTCWCDGDSSNAQIGVVGLSVGLYQPTRLLEVVKNPYCFPSLWGADMASGDQAVDGISAINLGSNGEHKKLEVSMETMKRHQVHLYSFPLLQILNILDAPKCVVDDFGSFDLMYMSEPFPNWQSDTLAFLTNPEALLFANDAAMAASALDCIAATGGDQGLDDVFWSAGCFGQHYPLTGNTVGIPSNVKSASLLSSRFLFLLSRLGFVRRTVGKDAQCEAQWMPMMKKSQFRFQQLWPIPESKDGPKKDPNASAPQGVSDNDPNGSERVDRIDMSDLGKTCCHSLGASTFTWGEWRNQPQDNGTKIFVLWQYTDCCVGLIGF